MERALSRDELRRLAFASVRPEIELFGGASSTGELIELDGVVASLLPAVPDRSVFNSVYADGPIELEAALDDLTEAYAAAGVRAWTVWIHDEDRVSAELLASRGHVLDGTPRAMALALEDLVEPAPLPDGYELGEGAIGEATPLNDIAYELEGPAWEAALDRDPDLATDGLSVRWAIARFEGTPVACAAGIDSGDDVAVTGVATVHAHQRRGLAATLIHRLLTEARERGMRTGSLQASKAGAPVYERIGFRNGGHFELWEHREEA